MVKSDVTLFPAPNYDFGPDQQRKDKCGTQYNLYFNVEKCIKYIFIRVNLSEWGREENGIPHFCEGMIDWTFWFCSSFNLERQTRLLIFKTLIKPNIPVGFSDLDTTGLQSMVVVKGPACFEIANSHTDTMKCRAGCQREMDKIDTLKTKWLSYLLVNSPWVYINMNCCRLKRWTGCEWRGGKGIAE